MVFYVQMLQQHDVTRRECATLRGKKIEFRKMFFYVQMLQQNDVTWKKHRMTLQLRGILKNVFLCTNVTMERSRRLLDVLQFTLNCPIERRTPKCN